MAELAGDPKCACRVLHGTITKRGFRVSRNCRKHSRFNLFHCDCVNV